MDLLLSYNWPGNVRELENAIEYAFARTKDSIIHSSKLPPNVRFGAKYNSIMRHKSELINQIDEVRQLRSVLEKCRWNRSEAAKELVIGQTTLWIKMKSLGLESA